jgi:hypothetical protein
LAQCKIGSSNNTCDLTWWHTQKFPDWVSNEMNSYLFVLVVVPFWVHATGLQFVCHCWKNYQSWHFAIVLDGLWLFWILNTS